MVAIVTGQGLGLFNTSGAVLGPQGQVGNALQGTAGEGVTVNAATGNLVVQHQDEWLVGRGPDAQVLRTYNSQGGADGDNGDQWRLGLSRKVHALTGTLNTAGSTVTRVGEDGAETVFTYSSTRAAYVSRSGAGSLDTLRQVAGFWIWSDQDSRTSEAYDVAKGGRLSSITDASNNTTTVGYNGAGLVNLVTDSGGGKTYIDYDTAAGKTTNIAQIRTEASGGTQKTRVRYGYDEANRLSRVTVDLTPDISTDAKNYVTDYTYIDGTSRKLASLRQSDGSELQFGYDTSGRITTVKDVRGSDIRTTTFDYAVAGQTSVTDAANRVIRLQYGTVAGQNLQQLTGIDAPGAGSTRQLTSFAYDANGNVSSITDPLGKLSSYGYDALGNRIYERDAAGNVVERIYGTASQLLSETRYATADPDGSGALQPGQPLTTRYVYDDRQRLRFQVSPEGRVTEYRYDAQGRRTSEISYSGGRYDLSSSALTLWSQSFDDASGMSALPAAYMSIQGGVLLSQTAASATEVWPGARSTAKHAFGSTITADIATGSSSAGRYLVFGADGGGTGPYRRHAVYFDGSNLYALVSDASGNRSTLLGTVQNNTTYVVEVETVPDGRSTIYARPKGEPRGAGYSHTATFTDWREAYVYVESHGAPSLPVATMALDNLTIAIPAGWGQTFASNADGLSPLPEGMTLVTGGLQLETKAATASAWPVARGTRVLPLGSSLHAEVTAGTASVGRGQLIGFSNGLTGTAERRYVVFFDNGLLRAQCIDASGKTVVTLGNIANGQSYQIDLVTQADGAVTLYVYETGKDRSSGFIDQRANVGWTSLQTYLETSIGPGIGATTLLVTNLTETPAYTEQTLAAWTATQGAASKMRTDYGYDVRGQLASQTVYAKLDAAGNGVSDGTQSTTQYVYDPYGNLLQVIDPRGVATTSIAGDYVTQYAYDGLHRLVMHTDALGSTTVTVHDDAARQVATTAANGLVTVAVRDQGGNVLSIASSNAGGALGTTRYAYDQLNRRVKAVDATGQASYTLYDEAGRVSGQVDAEGALTEYLYDRRDLLVQTIAYANKLTTTALSSLATNPSQGVAAVRPASGADRINRRLYDTAGRLVTTIDAAGAVSQFQYDALGRQVSTIQYYQLLSTAQMATLATLGTEVAPDNSNTAPSSGGGLDRRTRQIWSDDGLLVGAVDAEGYLIEHQYNAAGQRTRTTRYATRTALTDWSTATLASLRPASSTTDDQVTVYLYDPMGRLEGMVDAESYLTEYQYDLAGNQTAQIRYATRIAYMAGNGVQASRPAPGADARLLRQYDDLNRLVREESLPEGLVTTHTYDKAGNLVKTVRGDATIAAEQRTEHRRYDALGRLTEELGARGGAALAQLVAPTAAQVDDIWARYGTRHVYDQAGRRIATIASNGTSAEGNKTLYYYDAQGRMTHSINALGEVTQYSYNSFGEQTEQRQYANRLLTTTLSTLGGGLVPSALTTVLGSLANATLDSIRKTGYDLRGLVSSRTDARNYTDTFTYTAFGELNAHTQRIDASRTTRTAFGYDKLGRQQSIMVDAEAGKLNLMTYFFYDAFGRVMFAQDARGGSVQYAYDRLGRTVTTTDALNQTRTTAYDAFGRVLTQTDALGQSTTTSYDPATRSTTLRTPEGVSVKTVVNRFGQTVSVTDGNGVTTTTTYDTDGQVKSVSTPVGTQTIATTNEYDAVGRLSRTTDANGTKTELVYDAANRVLTRTVDPGGLALVTQYLYDAKGQQTSVTDPTGMVTEYTYDLEGRVTRQLVDAAPTGLKLSTLYTYDARGNTLTVTNPDAKVTRYTFDNAGRRTKEEIDVGGLNITRNYTYDQNNNLLTVSEPLGKQTRYSYDANNRVEYTLESVGSTGRLAVTRNIYDGNGLRIKQIRYANTIAGTALPSTVTTSASDQIQVWGYDKDGRQVFQVDAIGAVTARVLDGNGNVVASKQYAAPLSAANLATVQNTPATATTTLRAVLPATLGANDRVTHYVYDAASRLSYRVDAEGGIAFYSYDPQGNVIQRVEYAKPTNPLGLPDKATAADVAAKVVADAANDRATRSFYDAVGRQRFELDALGYATETRYTLTGKTTTVRYAQKPAGIAATTTTATFATAVAVLAGDANNQTTEVRLDTAGRVFETVDAMGVVTHLDLDKLGRVLAETRAYGLGVASKTTYTYNALDQALTKTVAAGTTAAATTQYGYDALGRLISQVEPNGVALQTENSAWAQAERQRLGYPVDAAALTTDHKTALRLAYTTTHAYDAAGNRTGTTNSLGGTTTTVYDVFGNAVKVTDPKGSTSFFYFDKLDRLSLQVNAEGYATETQYWQGLSNQVASVRRYATKVAAGTTEAARPTLQSVAAADGLVTTTYDRLDRVLSTTERVGTGTATESIQYSDSSGNRFNKRVTNKLNGTAAFTTDRLGRTTSETLPTTVVNSYQYDAFGNRTVTIEAQGRAEQRTTTYRYDKAGRTTHRIGQAYTALNSSTLSTSTVVPVEQTLYDALGRVIETRKAATWDGSNAIGGSRTLNWFDAQGHQVAQLAADGAYTAYSLDAAGNRMTETAHANRLALPGSPGGALPTAIPDAANDRVTRYVYDALGRQTRATRDTVLYWEQPAGANQLNLGVSGPGTVVLQQTVYDAVGNVVQSTDGRGNSTYAYYDKLGRRSFFIDQEGYATAWDYADFQNVATRETRFSTALTPALFRAQNDGSATAAQRDPVLLRQAMPAGTTEADRITEYVLDTTGHVLEKRVKNVAYEYTDTNGTVLKGVADAVTGYSINGLGLVTQLRERVSGTDASNVTNVTDISYDTLGRETQRQAPGFVDHLGVTRRPTSNIDYNGLGAVVRTVERGTDNTTEADDRITRYEYNTNGERIKLTDAENNATTFELDAQGRVARSTVRNVKNADGVATDQAVTFLYDATGRQTQTTDVGTGEVRKTAYNAFGEIVAKGLGDGWQETIEYGTNGKIQRSNAGDGVTKIYLYDRNGNTTRQIKSSTVNLALLSITAAAGDVNLVHTFSVYDRKNQLLKTVEPDISYLQDIVSVRQAFTQQLAPLYGAITIVDAAGGNYAGAAASVGVNLYTNVQAGGQYGLFPPSNAPYVSPIFGSLEGAYAGQTSVITNVLGAPASTTSTGAVTGGAFSYAIPSEGTGGTYRYRLVDRQNLGYWGNVDSGDGQNPHYFTLQTRGNVVGYGYSAQSIVVRLPADSQEYPFAYSLQRQPNPNVDTWEDVADVDSSFTRTYHETSSGPEYSYGWYDIAHRTVTNSHKKISVPPASWMAGGAVSFQAILNEGPYQTVLPLSPMGGSGFSNINLSGLGAGNYTLTVRAYDANGLQVGGWINGINVNGNSLTVTSTASITIPNAHTSGSRLYFDKFYGVTGAKTLYIRPYGSQGSYSPAIDASAGSVDLTGRGLVPGWWYEFVVTAGGSDWYGVFAIGGDGYPYIQNRGELNRMQGRDTTKAARGQTISFDVRNTLIGVAAGDSPANYFVDVGYGNGIGVRRFNLDSNWRFTISLDSDLPGLNASAFVAGSAGYSYAVYRNRANTPELVGKGDGSWTFGASPAASTLIPQFSFTPKAILALPAGTASRGPVTLTLNGTATVFAADDWRASLNAASSTLTVDLSPWFWNAGIKTFAVGFNVGLDRYSGTVTMNAQGQVTVSPLTRSSPDSFVKLTIPGASSMGVFKVGRTVGALTAVAPGSVTVSGTTFNWNAKDQQTAGGTWRYYYEVLGANSTLVGKGYGTLTVEADGRLVSTPDTPELKPTVVGFTPPAGTASFALRVLEPGGYKPYTLTSTDFSFVATHLRPASGSVGYQYDYVATSSTGAILSKGSGVITINANGSSSATLKLDRQETWIKLQSPPGRRVDKLSFEYRPQNSGAAFTLVTITGVWDAQLNATVFAWNASAIAPEGSPQAFDYRMRLKNQDGSDYRNEVGDPVTADGVMVLGGNTGSPLAFEQYVQTMSVGAQVKHMQTFNAFGEVVSEYDDRVQQRAQDMLDYYKRLPEYANEAAVQNATASTTAVTVQSRYNTLGQLISKTEPETWVTSEAGLHSRIAPRTSYGYDLLGRLNTLTDANNHQQRQSFLGSSTELLTAQWAADNGRKQFGYDIFSDARRQTNELNAVTEQSFNKLGQLVRVDQLNVGRVQNFTGGADGTAVASTLTDLYTYDALGQRLSHTDALGQTSKTWYDSLGRVTRTLSAGGGSVSYDYSYFAAGSSAGAILGLNGASVGGYQRKTTGVDGRSLYDNIEYFGRTTWHQDAGGRKYTYSYDVAGQLRSQTSTLNGAALQNIQYDYYANGYIKSARDLSMRTFSRYGYDNAGNRTWESYSGLATDNVNPLGSYQNIVVQYDELNRMAHVKDSSVDVQYEYDAVGNRRAVHATYFDPLTQGLRQRDDMWYLYDAADRFILTKGSLTAPGGQIVQGAQGVRIGYDAAGQRTSATNADGSVETYSYSADGYLEDTRINGTLRARRRVDVLGRTLEYKEFNADTSVRQSTRSTYTADNRLQRTVDLNGTTNYFYFTDTADTDTAASQTGQGQLARTVFTPSAAGTVGTTNYYTYQYWDDAKQSTIKTQATWAPGTSQLLYDVNGFLTDANDVVAGRNVHYTNSATGLVMRRDESVGVKTYQHFYYYADGRRIGDVSTDPNDKYRKSYAEELAVDLKHQPSNADRFKNFRPVTSADFDQNYEPINASYPAAASSTYTVRGGETLQAIASALWGDGAMWYLLAEANGLSGTENLVAGRVLLVPNKVTNIHNNADTFRPYNAGEMIGNIDPTLPAPPPPKKKGCGGIGLIIGIVVTAVLMAYNVTTVLAAAGGNVAGQVASIATGEQKGVNWKSLAMSAVSAGVAQGVDALAQGTALAGKGAGAMMAKAAIGNVVSQGIGVATGLQDKFSWAGVATAAIGAGVTSMVSEELSGGTYTERRADGQSVRVAANPVFGHSVAGTVALNVVSGMAGSVVAQLVAMGKVDPRSTFANTVGNMIGDALAGTISSGSSYVSPEEWLRDQFWEQSLGPVDSRNQYKVYNDGDVARSELRFNNTSPSYDFVSIDTAAGSAARYAGDWTGSSQMDRSNDVLVAAAGLNPKKLGGGVIDLGDGRWYMPNGQIVQAPENAQVSINIVSSLQAASSQLVRGGTVAERATGRAAFLSGEAQATSALYAAGYGDIRETVTPLTSAGTQELSLAAAAQQATNAYSVGDAVSDIAVGAAHAVVDTFVQPGMQVRDLAVAAAAVGYNELIRLFTGGEMWLPDMKSGLATAYAQGTSQGKLLASAVPVVNVGVFSYDTTTALMDGRYQDAARSAGGFLGGVAVGAGAQRYGAYGLQIGANGLGSNLGSLRISLVHPNLVGSGRALAANLGGVPGGYQAHHLIMSELAHTSDALTYLARKGLYDVNAASNGRAYPGNPLSAADSGLPLHSGYHGLEYRTAVANELRGLDVAHASGASDAALLARVSRIQDRLATNLESGNLWLNSVDALHRKLGEYAP